MTIETVPVARARALVADGARLVDVRPRDEHARTRIPGALNVPVAELATLRAGPAGVVFHCRSGARTAAHAATLAAAADGAPAWILDGGLDAWGRAGLPVETDRRQPLELMRQVQIVSGALVLLGVVLGVLVAPAFLGLSAFVGAGLMFAGITGWCGMARLLAHMPWNRARLTPHAPAVAG
ncbi:rhodanese-like domain-containing protein [Zavarzinia sp. CC-PAN008]|uniref:rhodanese-like domain-containing protein n=1 Tax=Zavarzinia sp. CC-PAN008 TaxID=3243332 RepID=UPI003F746EF9